MKMNRTVVRWALLTLVVLSLGAASFGQIGVGISVRIGPPALPVYAQPICPGPGYFWTPGYWGWNDDGGYYWVPGTWVIAPVGMLWTPGYWGWGGGFYRGTPDIGARISVSTAVLITASVMAASALSAASGAAARSSTTAR